MYSAMSAILARTIFVGGQFLVLWAYSNAFSIPELATYNSAVVISIMVSTLILHPFDTNLQRRYVKRLSMDNSMRSLEDFYFLLFLVLIVVFLVFLFLHKLIEGYVQYAFLGFIISIGSYLTFSIRNLFLNAGKLRVFNLLLVVETLAKLGLMFVLELLGIFNLTSFVIVLVLTQFIAYFYFRFYTLRVAASLNFRYIKISILMLDRSFLSRTLGNLYHWIVANAFKIVLLASNNTELMASGLTMFAFGNSASQSINMLVGQYFYPSLYASKGRDFSRFIVSLILLNLIGACLVYAGFKLVLINYFPESFSRFTYLLIPGMLVEMLNGILGPLGIRENFRNNDSGIRKMYQVSTSISVGILLLLVLLSLYQFLFFVPLVSLLGGLVYYARMESFND